MIVEEDTNPEEGGDFEAQPLCKGCLAPYELSDHYCDHCGQAVGRVTEYLPYEGIRWEASFYDRLRRVAAPTKGGVAFRILAMAFTVLLAPFILLGLNIPFARKAKDVETK